MTPNRHGSAVVEFPSELEIVTTRKFDAPIKLVYDALTKPEHVRNWWATGGDSMTVCEIDLRVGGDYHIVFVTPDGKECSFRGTYLELDPPHKTVQTWWFEGWGPDTDAVETAVLAEENGVTRLALTVVFNSAHGRSHMQKHDGQEDSFDKLEDYLHSLLEAE